MSGHALFTLTPNVFLLNIFINKTKRSIYFYWIHFLNKILTWLMREYVYLWHRFIDINVGTQDTAADEMLTKKMALKISGTIASHWLVINKSESHTNFLSFTLNEIVITHFNEYFVLCFCVFKTIVCWKLSVLISNQFLRAQMTRG